MNRDIITQGDFIASYNHTLSSTFSHPTLPFVHHAHNWSACPSVISLPTEANALSLSPDESLLAVAAGSDVLIYNTDGDMDLKYTLKGHMGWITNVEWYPGEGRKLVSGSSPYGQYSEQAVRFWDLNPDNASHEVRIDLDGDNIGTAASAGGGFVCQARMGNKFEENQHNFAVPIDPHEAKADKESAKVDLEGISKLATAAAAEPLVSEAGWTNDEISRTGLQSLILTALRGAEFERSKIRGYTLTGQLPSFGSSAFSPDGSILFYLPTHNTVAVVSASTRLEMFRLEGHTDGIMWVGASPDGKLAATSSWDDTVKIWDLQDGKLMRTLKGARNQNWIGRWSPDGTLIAVGNGDSILRVWDVLSGKLVYAFGDGEKMFSGWVRGLAFEQGNGGYLVASSEGGTVRVFDTHSGKCINLYQIDPIASSTLPRQVAMGFMEISDSLIHAPSPSQRFGFKPTDGRLVVYDTEHNKMWEFVTDKEGSAREFGSGVFVFGNGGKRVYSGDVDGKLRVWDLE